MVSRFFRLEVAMNNVAFSSDQLGRPCPELARILRSLADKLEIGANGDKVLDSSGAAVGRFDLFSSEE